MDRINQAAHDRAEHAKEPKVRCREGYDGDCEAENEAGRYDEPEAPEHVIGVADSWCHDS